MNAMDILLDACLAFLSCVGIWTLGRMIYSHFVEKSSKSDEECFLKDEAEVWTKPGSTMK